MRISDFKQVMLSYLHQTYIFGGDDPIAGFDCSGLVIELLKILGKAPSYDTTAQGLYEFLTKTAHDDKRETGAMCFYGKSFKEITHIAIHFDETTVLEAGGGGSSTVSEAAAIKQNAYIRLRPYNARKDYLGTVRMPFPNLIW